MLEIEVKFPAETWDRVEMELARCQAEPMESRDDADHYFNAPDRDFAQTDEAFRLRCIGERNFITYKGPKRDLQTKTRTEIEVPLGAGGEVADATARLFVHLGYRPVATVRKHRRIYRLHRDSFEVEVCLDTVAEVGQFVEIEIVADESALVQARQVVLQLAEEFGLRDQERRSYLEMLLNRRGQR